jgi:riboflavin transporter FmnP
MGGYDRGQRLYVWRRGYMSVITAHTHTASTSVPTAVGAMCVGTVTAVEVMSILNTSTVVIVAATRPAGATMCRL